MAVTAAKLRAVVTADTSQGQAGLRAFGKQVSATRTQTNQEVASIAGAFRGLGGALGGLVGVVGLAGVGVTLLNFGREAVGAASDLSESYNKVGVVFRELQGEITDFASDSTTALGMSRQAAYEALGTFGNLFTAMGVGRQQSAEMAEGLTQLAADLGSFNNIDPTVALEKLRAGIVGEAEPLRALGINLTAANTEAKALELGLMRAGEELSTQAAVAARYALIMEQSASAQGDFARTADGLANASRTAAGEFENLKANLGKLVEKPYTAVVHVVADTLGDINQMLESTPESRREYKITLDLDLAQQRLREAEEGLRKATENGEYLGNTTAAWAGQVEQAKVAIAEAEEGLRRATEQGVYLGESAATWAGRVRDATADLADAESGLRRAAENGEYLSGRTADWANQVDQAKVAVVEAEIALARLNGTLGETGFNDWGDVGVGAANRVRDAALEAWGAMQIASAASADAVAQAQAAVAKAYGWGKEHIGLIASRAGEGKPTEPTPVIGSAAWVAEQATQQRMAELRRLIAEQESANTRVTRDYADKMTGVIGEVADAYRSAMSEAQQDSIGLLDLRPGGAQGSNAPGQNGAFEDIYRLQAFIQNGSWGETAAKYGLDQAGATEVVKKFQTGMWDASVMGIVDKEQLAKQIQDAQVAQTMMDAVAADLAKVSKADPKLIKAMLGLNATGQGETADLPVFMPSFLARIDGELKDNQKALAARGKQLWDALGGAFVEQAGQDAAFARAVTALVQQALTAELS